MNNAKWNEIFDAFYQHQINVGTDNKQQIFFRVKSVRPASGFGDFWDCDWEHFGSLFRFYSEIDELQLLVNDHNRSYVLDVLHSIHVPGKIADDVITVFGYNTNCDYL